MKLRTYSSHETQELAATVSALILAESPRRHAYVVALKGELGGGKTTFTQGFIRSFGFRGRVASPTFVIMKRYPVRQTGTGSFKNIYHIDCYRLRSSAQLTALGFREVLSDPHNLLLIEWPERVDDLIPSDALRVVCDHGRTPDERTITIPQF